MATSPARRIRQLLRHQKRGIRRQQRQRDLDAGIARPAAQAQARPADADPEGDFADDNNGKIGGGLHEGEKAGDYRSNSEAIKDQGRGIISETLTLEHNDQPPRHAEPPHDGKRCDHVGWRDDRAEHNAHGPRHAERIVGDRRNSGGGENDAAEGEQRDRAEIKAEFAPAHGKARRVDQRRQDAEQHQFRRQYDTRQAGNERQHDAGDNEQNGWRGVKPLGHDSDDHQHREQQQYGVDGRRHRLYDAGYKGAVKPVRHQGASITLTETENGWTQ